MSFVEELEIALNHVVEKGLTPLQIFVSPSMYKDLLKEACSIQYMNKFKNTFDNLIMSTNIMDISIASDDELDQHFMITVAVEDYTRLN